MKTFNSVCVILMTVLGIVTLASGTDKTQGLLFIIFARIISIDGDVESIKDMLKVMR